MLIALDVNATRDYSLLQDSGEDRTVFSIGQLDSITRSYIDDQHTVYDFKDESDPIKTRINDKLLDIVRFGLKGWKNFKDNKGTEIEFKTVEKSFKSIGKRTVVSDECLNRLNFKWIQEIAVQIISDNTFNEDDKKK